METLTDLLDRKLLIGQLKDASFFELYLLAGHQRSPNFRLGIELSLDDDLIDLSFLVVIELIISLCKLAS